MENSYIWSINGCEFEVDMEDAETVDRYASALKVLENADNRQVSNISEQIRTYCKTFREFYDVFLGEGTSEKIFSGISDNSRKYDEVFESLLDVISRQRAESESRIAGIARRYAPKRR
ncbi:MAG: hypothetical protein NC040_09375 [Muribaculaceae bacterium]|nr:hypothetical protein [Alistipes senegalensis]MCM1474259.1 hypothetical protein [Muribaculaceae bacterium]